MRKPGSATDPLWYKDAVIYQLSVKGFYDSNNDGIGDFPGLLQKLDYLQDLGVTCLWLLPFFPSPLRDGYDISDYRSIHPSYGTIEDFQAFLNAAHDHGMQVMIELVVNHTSDQHPWFQAARQAAPGSPERDFYVWSDSDQKFRDARIIFTDTEKSNWTWDPVAQAYYWHRFFFISPTSTSTPPRSSARSWTSCVSGWTEALTLSVSTPSRTWSSATAPTARTCPRPTRWSRAPVARWTSITSTG